jgi:hypothetical protein
MPFAEEATAYFGNLLLIELVIFFNTRLVLTE